MLIKPGDTLAVLGDSITDPAIWAADAGCLFDMVIAKVVGYRTIRVVNAGFSGATSANILASHMAPITSLSPPANVVITEIGTNDFWFAPVPFSTFAANMVAIWTAIRAASPNVQLASVSLLSIQEDYPDSLGSMIDAWNVQLIALCAANNVEYIDVRTPQQAYEQANNTPPPGVHQGLLTVDGTHPIHAGRVLMSTAAFAHFAFGGIYRMKWNSSGPLWNKSGPRWTKSGPLWSKSGPLWTSLADTSFTPASLGTTLKGWFRADLGVTGSPVTSFQNQVAGGPSITDEGFADGPLFAASGTGLNNQPRLVFDGTHHTRNLVAPLVPTAGGARTVAVVCRGSTTQGGALYTNRVTANWRSCQLYNLSGSTYALGTGSSNITFNVQPTILDTDHLMIYTEDGAGNLTVTVDGTLAALSSGTIADVENGIVGFELANAGGNGFIGSIPEWVICDTALSGTPLTNLKSYFATRYALTVA